MRQIIGYFQRRLIAAAPYNDIEWTVVLLAGRIAVGLSPVVAHERDSRLSSKSREQQMPQLTIRNGYDGLAPLRLLVNGLADPCHDITRRREMMCTAPASTNGRKRANHDRNPPSHPPHTSLSPGSGVSGCTNLQWGRKNVKSSHIALCADAY